MCRRSITHRLVALILVLHLPSAALADKGTLAVVNLSAGGWEVAQRSAREMGQLVGGWARQPGIGAYLAGRPNPGALPVGDTGKDLARLVQRIRSGARPAGSDLAALGRLLGVDYLLLLKVRPTRLSGRLFSVHRRSYAPQGYEGKPADSATLVSYVRQQTGAAGAGKKKTTSKAKWVIWAVAAALAAVTIGLAVASQDDTEGDLRIRVRR